MPHLFSCCLSGSIIVGEFVAPYRSVDCSDEIVKDFYRLSVMSVDFRLFVNNDLFDERAQYFGREFFKTVILVNKHHKRMFEMINLSKNGVYARFTRLLLF